MLDGQVSRGEDVEHVVLVLKREGLDGLLREVLLERVIEVVLQLPAQGIVFAEEREHFCELRGLVQCNVVEHVLTFFHVDAT